MYEEDYEIYGEPSQADLIIQEAVVKLKAILNSDITAIIENNERQSKEFDDKFGDIRKKEKELRLKEDNVYKREQQLVSAKEKLTQELYEELLKKFDLDLKYGQNVWYFEKKYKTENCEFCEGKTNIECLIKGEKTYAKCPKCANGYVSKTTGYEIRTSKVDYIHRHLYVSNKTINTSGYSNDTRICLIACERSRNEIYLTEEECLLAVEAEKTKDNFKE